MAWRVARSLDQLLAQLNALAPQRSKLSDGAKGDTAHSSRTSDHNPDASGVVRARDFTHDPRGGLDCHRLAAQLVAARDPRIRYIIWDRRIWTPSKGWQPYHGPNLHTKHLHLSVIAGPGADSLARWDLRGLASEGFLMALSDKEQRDLYDRVFGMLRQRYYETDQFGVVHELSAPTPNSRPATVLDTLDGNYLVRRIEAVAAEVSALKAAPAAPAIDYERFVSDVVERLAAKLGRVADP